MVLAKAGVPTPRTFVALSAESVDQTADLLGYPIVLKPFVGSWGRMISIARDAQTLDTIVELRESIPNPIEHMYYLQDFVERPPRDIRAIVAGEEIIATVYRHASENEWRTNVASGATTTSFKPDKELTEIVHKAAHAVGGGILGVDVMESKEGYVVHEVNNTVEFKGAQAASKTKIAKKMIEFVDQEREAVDGPRRGRGRLRVRRRGARQAAPEAREGRPHLRDLRRGTSASTSSGSTRTSGG